MDNKPINSISDALTRITDLTEKNLNILKTIEESFRTRRSHLGVDIDGTTYSIPSFISLETRIETMEHNLENILNAPLTGEAFVYHDGTTQKMELSGYSVTPNHVDVKIERDNITGNGLFNVEQNSIFKDFMNPNPYIHIDIASIPNTTKHVNIRKIIIKDGAIALQDAINNVIETDGSIKYEDWYRIAFGYEEGVDYEQYDTTKRLPLRDGLAQGTYIIESIEDHHIDSNFEEHYTVVLDKDLVYYVNNGTIQRDIEIGDYLVTYNDKVQMVVEDVNHLTRTITFKIMYGAYSDLQDVTSGNTDLYTIKYYHAANDDKLREFNKTKYINVSVEEDKYIMVFVAPINDTTNVQAPWGTGIYIDTDSLTLKSTGTPFRDYYNDNVNNIGDALAAITSMMDDDEQVSRLTPTEFATAYNYIPHWNESLIKVTQINKHLNDAKSIKAIRNLYAQKEQLNQELETIRFNIDKLNQELATLSFDDTTNQRTIHETNLREAMARRSELTNSILQVCQEIALQANNSDVPIENAKYRIRGFVDLQMLGLPDMVKPIKIDVQYRYKCSSSFTGAAETYGDRYIYSDWNNMESPYRRRIPSLNSAGQYVYDWEEFNENKNEPSFNQIDIPITQGETVDVRVRLVYNLGHPFAEMTSSWSPILSVNFPDELKQKVDVLDIITQNNSEIEQQSLQNLIDKNGLTEHINDTIQDQTIKFKHSADNITSGFFTQERRIIPLSDKLFSMDEFITELQNEVYGNNTNNLLVTLSSKDNAIQLKPWTLNTFHAGSYTRAINNDSTFKFSTEDETDYEPVFAVCQLNINIKNIGSSNMRLHSLFPGDHNTPLTDNISSPFYRTNYITETDNVNEPDGVWMMLDEQNDEGELAVTQRRNQFLYFRTALEGLDILDPQAGSANERKFYSSCNPLDLSTRLIRNGSTPLTRKVPNYSNVASKENIIELLSPDSTDNIGKKLYNIMGNSEPGSSMGVLYPYPGQMGNICIPTSQTFKVLKPGEGVNVPIQFIYWFQDATDDNLISLAQKTRYPVAGIQTDVKLQNFADTLFEVANTTDDYNALKTAMKSREIINNENYKKFKANFVSPAKMRNFTITRMMAFDIRPNLYSEPITYKFTVSASYEDTKGFQIKAKNISESGALPLNSVVPQTALAKLVESDVKGSGLIKKSSVNLK